MTFVSSVEMIDNKIVVILSWKEIRRRISDIEEEYGVIIGDIK